MNVGVVKEPVSAEGQHTIVPYIQCGRIVLELPEYDLLGVFKDEATERALSAEHIAGAICTYFDTDTWFIHKHGHIAARRFREYIASKVKDVAIIDIKEERKHTV